jgi:hypothetical protein
MSLVVAGAALVALLLVALLKGLAIHVAPVLAHLIVAAIRVVRGTVRLMAKAPRTLRAVQLDDLLHVLAELRTIPQFLQAIIDATVVGSHFRVRGLHCIASLALALKLLKDTPSLIVRTAWHFVTA